MSTSTNDHLTWLQDKLSTYESKVTEAEATVAKLKPIVSNLHTVIAAFIAEDQGPLPDRDMFGNEATHQNRYQETGHLGKPFTQGNRSPDMPNRRPEFANYTLISAACKILHDAPDILHANDITKAVFEIRDKASFHKAKHSMVSELYRGAKKGMLTSLGDNKYRCK